jgi:DNA-directed RNA polymerase I subunit RPA1
MVAQGKYTHEVVKRKKPLEKQSSIEADLGIEMSDDEMEVDEEQVPNHDDEDDKATYMTPLQIQEHMKLLWRNEKSFLDLIYGSLVMDNRKTSSNLPRYYRNSSADMFILKYIAVPPCKFRPISVLGEMKFDHAQNGYLSEILKSCLILRDIVNPQAAEKKDDGEKSTSLTKEDSEVPSVIRTWIEIQQQVNAMIDSSLANSAKFGRDPPAGIKQILEKKEGLFRKHMMVSDTSHIMTFG